MVALAPLNSKSFSRKVYNINTTAVSKCRIECFLTAWKCTETVFNYRIAYRCIQFHVFNMDIYKISSLVCSTSYLPKWIVNSQQLTKTILHEWKIIFKPSSLLMMKSETGSAKPPWIITLTETLTVMMHIVRQHWWLSPLVPQL